MTTPSQGLRIERIELNERAAWRKRPEADRTSIFTAMHYILKPVLPEVLHPTNASGGIKRLHREAARLQRFADRGICVPELLEKTNSYITLADCGPQLRAVLRKEMNFETRFILLESAMRTLAFLHTKRLAHGRPYLKDMTLKKTLEAPNGIIYLLDLEEDPTAIMSIDNAQARDVWLLLLSSAEFCDDPEASLHKLLGVYQRANTSDLTNALRALGRSLRPFRRFIGAVRATNISNDVRGAYWSIRVLEAL